MQVVSGAMGKEKIHYEAPKAAIVEAEMTQFLKWLNNGVEVDPVLKAGVAHFWFVTLHPFDGGNGRIARAIMDMQLARSDKSSQRFYSMSNQILTERKKCYEVLERTQRGKSEITEWLEWFISCLEQALENSREVLEAVIAKSRFWEQYTPLNGRQRLMLNRLLNSFEVG